MDSALLTRFSKPLITIYEAPSSPLKEQAEAIPPTIDETISQAKREKKTTKRTMENLTFDDLSKKVNSRIHRSLTLSKEKRASNWLTVLPIAEHGFALHKRDFRDALSLRYGWSPKHLPSSCVCGNPFSVEHALSCNSRGFPIKWHNELRDLTANLLDKICDGVGVEPTLQPLAQERLHLKTANRQDGARLDVVAEGFWGSRQRAIF